MAGHVQGVTSHAHRERFRQLYEAHFDDLLAYAARRVEPQHDAADVVADAFMVAWRRVDEIPDGDDARLWLFGVARKLVFNQRRGRLRRDRLGARLRLDMTKAAADDPEGEATQRATVRAALARLGELDREVLTLTVWEELQPREIAEVLGISAGTVRTRLSRARGRLREVLGNDLGRAGHVRGVNAQTAAEEGR